MATAAPEFAIRPLERRDSLDEMTGLLHRAYRPLAEAGMRFLASHQDVQTTRERCLGDGRYCLVAERDGRLVGTITLWRPAPDSKCGHYRREGIVVFGQFAVEPSLQRRGLGRRLLNEVETLAASLGAAELCCDTSENAIDLIRWYLSLGYAEVERVRWDVTNYRSVVLSKSVRRGGEPPHR